MKRYDIFYNDVHYRVNSELFMTSVRVNKELYKYVQNYFCGSFADFVNSCMLNFVQNNCVEDFLYFKFGVGKD